MICLQKQATNTPSFLQKCFEKPQEANGHKELPTSDAPESPPLQTRLASAQHSRKKRKQATSRAKSYLRKVRLMY